MKDCKKTKESIIEMVRDLNPTKKVLCKKHDITWQTLKNWLEKDKSFAEQYKQAIKDYLDGINVEAKKSLSKLITGYYYEEEKTFYMPDAEGNPVITQKVVVKKHVPPSASAVTFALSNLEPENFE